MIQKQDYYHGAAIIGIIDNKSFMTIKSYEGGYIVNEDVFLYLKYRTNTAKKWNFTIAKQETSLLEIMSSMCTKTIIAFICGEDGICPITYEEFKNINSNKDGWVFIKRNFNKWYSVSGKTNFFEKKISRKRWPDIIFDEMRDSYDNK